MNATGAPRFRLGACFFEWRLHPRGRAPSARARAWPAWLASAGSQAARPLGLSVVSALRRLKERAPPRGSAAAVQPPVRERGAARGARCARGSRPRRGRRPAASLLLVGGRRRAWACRPLRRRCTEVIGSERCVVSPAREAARELLARVASRRSARARGPRRLSSGSLVESVVLPARPRARALRDPPSNEARLPAELKHITKRRRRN